MYCQVTVDATLAHCKVGWALGIDGEQADDQADGLTEKPQDKHPLGAETETPTNFLCSIACKKLMIVLQESR